jgi:hypothetical protein
MQLCKPGDAAQTALGSSGQQDMYRWWYKSVISPGVSMLHRREEAREQQAKKAVFS